MESVAVDASSGERHMTVFLCCEETAKGSARDSRREDDDEDEEEGSEEPALAWEEEEEEGTVTGELRFSFSLAPGGPRG